MSDPDWNNTLRDAARERYQSLHMIRDRVHKTCLWALSAMIAVSGWVVQQGSSLGLAQRIYLLLATGAIVAVLRLTYLRDLENGFRMQQQVAVRVEEELGLYREIYPLEWRRAGTEHSKGRFFAATYRLLYFGFLFFLVTLIFDSWLAGLCLIVRCQ